MKSTQREPNLWSERFTQKTRRLKVFEHIRDQTEEEEGEEEEWADRTQ